MSQGKISKKQLEILEYIKSQILERGFPLLYARFVRLLI